MLYSKLRVGNYSRVEFLREIVLVRAQLKREDSGPSQIMLGDILLGDSARDRDQPWRQVANVSFAILASAGVGGPTERRARRSRRFRPAVPLRGGGCGHRELRGRFERARRRKPD
jgi:hypothetical protein